MQGIDKTGKPYVVAFYIRLSQEDRDVNYIQKTESNSITNQRELLWDYVNSHEEFKGCTVIEKCDDGYSGVNFDDRPKFNELRELINSGRIDCVIVKDFSRLGRDYVTLGDYIEQIFPFLGIRFISVNDGYDSMAVGDGETGGMDVAFRNIMYDYYSRELSRKQKLSWKRMAENGKYSASCAFYGYQKSLDNNHKLLIHEETACVVREIFEQIISGISAANIARSLNEREISPPSEFHYTEGFRYNWRRYGSKNYWTENTIRRIIRDERYTGTLIMLKTETVGVKGKRKRCPPETWVRKEKAFEAIISYDMYARANSMTKPSNFKATKNSRINIYRCGYCGRYMQQYGRENIMICNQRRYRKECDCKRAMIHDKNRMDQVVLQAVRNEIEIYLEAENLSVPTGNHTSQMSLEMECRAIQKSLDAVQQSWMALYSKYNDDIINKEEYLEKKKQYDSDKESLQKKLEEKCKELQEQQNRRNISKREESKIRSYIEQTELTENIKKNLIDKVLVYGENRIEIVWKFRREQ